MCSFDLYDIICLESIENKVSYGLLKVHSFSEFEIWKWYMKVAQSNMLYCIMFRVKMVHFDVFSLLKIEI